MAQARALVLRVRFLVTKRVQICVFKLSRTRVCFCCLGPSLLSDINPTLNAMAASVCRSMRDQLV